MYGAACVCFRVHIRRALGCLARGVAHRPLQAPGKSKEKTYPCLLQTGASASLHLIWASLPWASHQRILLISQAHMVCASKRAASRRHRRGRNTASARIKCFLLSHIVCASQYCTHQGYFPCPETPNTQGCTPLPPETPNTISKPRHRSRSNFMLGSCCFGLTLLI